jgi:hypothetical protein
VLWEIPGTLSADENGAPFFFRERNVAFDFAKVGLAHERAHVGRRVLRISDPELLDSLQKAVEELVVDGFLDEETRSAKADFALVGDARMNGCGDGV